MGWGFTTGLAGWFLPGVSKTVVASCWLEMQSSAVPTGREAPNGALMWLATEAGCPQRAQLGLTLEHLHMAAPCCMGFSQHGGWLPRVCILRGGIWRTGHLKRSHTLLLTWKSPSVIPHLICCKQVTKSSLDSRGWELCPCLIHHNSHLQIE